MSHEHISAINGSCFGKLVSWIQIGIKVALILCVYNCVDEMVFAMFLWFYLS